MDRFEKGMLVRSKAGHDAGEIFIITGTEDAYVYLADGRLRTLQKPKKKKKKHVQIILQQYDIQDADDVKISHVCFTSSDRLFRTFRKTRAYLQ